MSNVRNTKSLTTHSYVDGKKLKQMTSKPSNTLQSIRYLLLVLAASLASCNLPAEDDHGHPHAADGSHLPAGPAASATIWTNKTELFVEFPVLTVGVTSQFAAHFTVLDKHQPVTDGTVSVSLVSGSKGIRHSVNEATSPGIFTPALQPKVPGVYNLIFDLTTTQYTDRMVIPNVRVYETAEEAAEAVGGGTADEAAISFLKEQSWKTDFQTVPVSKKEIYQTISTSGIWKFAPADHEALVATASGRVSYMLGNLTKGKEVKKGQVLMMISSTGLSDNDLTAHVKKAKANLDQATSSYERKKKLYESRIVPKAELEVAQQKYEVAKANHESLSAGYSAGGRQIIVPFDGYLTSVSAVNGGFVEQGAPLAKIASHQSSLLEAQVHPSYAAELRTIQNVWYQPAPGIWSSIATGGGQVLSVGREVELDQPLLSVFAEVLEEVEMPEGSFTEVQLAVGEPIERIVVPAAALLEDYGKYSVFVQLSGEGFERRNVTLGRRNGMEVEVTSGLKLGEVIVVKGAYQVKMAAMAGEAPAHGHAH